LQRFSVSECLVVILGEGDARADPNRCSSYINKVALPHVQGRWLQPFLFQLFHSNNTNCRNVFSLLFCLFNKPFRFLGLKSSGHMFCFRRFDPFEFRRLKAGSGRSANNFCGWYFWCFGRRGSVSIAMTSRNTLRLLVTDVLFTTNEQFLLWNFSSKAWKLAKVCVRAWRQDILCKREKTEAWRLPLLRLWWSVPQVTSFYADIPTMREIFWRFFNFVSKPRMKI